MTRYGWEPSGWPDRLGERVSTMPRISPFHALWPALGVSAALAGWAPPNQPATPAGAAGKPAAARAQTHSHEHCFRRQDIDGWRAGDDRTVYVSVGVRRVFRMELMAACPDVNWAERIGIEARGSPWICSGLDATIIAPSSIGPHRCPVTNIVELTPAEVAAMPKKHRP